MGHAASLKDKNTTTPTSVSRWGIILTAGGYVHQRVGRDTPVCSYVWKIVCNIGCVCIFLINLVSSSVDVCVKRHIL